MAMITLDDELADGSLTILNVFEPKLQLERKGSENTIAHIAVSFLTPLHWQSIHRLSRDAHRTIDAYWRCARRNVFSSVRMWAIDDGRCDICGWLPGRRFSATFPTKWHVLRVRLARYLRGLHVLRTWTGPSMRGLLRGAGLYIPAEQTRHHRC